MSEAQQRARKEKLCRARGRERCRREVEELLPHDAVGEESGGSKKKPDAKELQARLDEMRRCRERQRRQWSHQQQIRSEIEKTDWEPPQAPQLPNAKDDARNLGGHHLPPPHPDHHGWEWGPPPSGYYGSNQYHRPSQEDKPSSSHLPQGDGGGYGSRQHPSHNAPHQGHRYPPPSPYYYPYPRHGHGHSHPQHPPPPYPPPYPHGWHYPSNGYYYHPPPPQENHVANQEKEKTTKHENNTPPTHQRRKNYSFREVGSVAKVRGEDGLQCDGVPARDDRDVKHSSRRPPSSSNQYYWHGYNSYPPPYNCPPYPTQHSHHSDHGDPPPHSYFEPPRTNIRQGHQNEEKEEEGAKKRTKDNKKDEHQPEGRPRAAAPPPAPALRRYVTASPAAAAKATGQPPRAKKEASRGVCSEETGQEARKERSRPKAWVGTVAAGGDGQKGRPPRREKGKENDNGSGRREKDGEPMLPPNASAADGLRVRISPQHHSCGDFTLSVDPPAAAGDEVDEDSLARWQVLQEYELRLSEYHLSKYVELGERMRVMLSPTTNGKDEKGKNGSEGNSEDSYQALRHMREVAAKKYREHADRCSYFQEHISEHYRSRQRKRPGAAPLDEGKRDMDAETDLSAAEKDQDGQVAVARKRRKERESGVRPVVHDGPQDCQHDDTVGGMAPIAGSSLPPALPPIDGTSLALGLQEQPLPPALPAVQNDERDASYTNLTARASLIMQLFRAKIDFVQEQMMNVRREWERLQKEESATMTTMAAAKHNGLWASQSTPIAKPDECLSARELPTKER